jgi:acyl phosphate:glycerol-3-phosphate acyltransferase
MSWLLLVLAYGVGAIPTSHLAGRLRGVDLRDHGSGNLGATNTFRILGWRAALPVMVLDVGKGWIPTAIFPLWAGVAGLEWAVAYGALAIVGHVFSVFVRFKGGKGVATSAGVFLALAPWAVLIGFLVWGISVVLTRIVSVGSILAALVLPLAVYATNEPRLVFWVSVVLSMLVIYAHRVNVRRLVRGEEHRFGRSPEGAR